VHPFFARDSRTTAFFEEANPNGQGTLYYQIMSAAKRFDKHSLEVCICLPLLRACGFNLGWNTFTLQELRVVFLQAGRELDSSQITPVPALGIAPTSSVSTLFGAAGGGPLTHSPATRRF
jgi:hypothetical protein